MKDYYDIAPPAHQPGNMQGFDPEFSDIVDYILRITLRIWEGKQVGLCRDYYSTDCPVYTLAGYTEGAEAVTQNTLRTLAAFPDRTLHADNIVWGGDDQQGFHTSHLIHTRMTNLGPSEFGASTGKQADFYVIAHCVVKHNRIIEEWLVRDNIRLSRQMGVDPWTWARSQAAQPLATDSRLLSWYNEEIARVSAAPEDSNAGLGNSEPEVLVCNALQNIWNNRLLGDCQLLYADNACLHASGRDDCTGVDNIARFYLAVLGAMPDARISLDYVCSNSMLTDSNYVAVRWTLAGNHTGRSLWGEPSGAPLLILGESHYRIVANQVVEEWLVFDELAVMTWIERARLAQAAMHG